MKDWYFTVILGIFSMLLYLFTENIELLIYFGFLTTFFGILSILERLDCIMSEDDYYWESYDEWCEKESINSKDLRGCGYPIVRIAWEAGRLKKKEVK